MKNLYHILFYSIVICLVITIGQNYFLWNEIRNQESYISSVTDDLIDSNNLLFEKVYKQHEFSKNTDRKDLFPQNADELEKLKSTKDAQRSDEVLGIHRYDKEKIRKQNLEKYYFKSRIKYLLPRRIVTKTSHQDSLYIGYTKNLFQDTKYELKVNNQSLDYTLGNRYTFPKDSSYRIELKKITISDDGLSIDSTKAIRILNGV